MHFLALFGFGIQNFKNARFINFWSTLFKEKMQINTTLTAFYVYVTRKLRYVTRNVNVKCRKGPCKSITESLRVNWRNDVNLRVSWRQEKFLYA